MVPRNSDTSDNNTHYYWGRLEGGTGSQCIRNPHTTMDVNARTVWYADKSLDGPCVSFQSGTYFEHHFFLCVKEQCHGGGGCLIGVGPYELRHDGGAASFSELSI